MAVSGVAKTAIRRRVPHAILEGRFGAQAWKGDAGDPPSASPGWLVARVVMLQGRPDSEHAGRFVFGPSRAGTGLWISFPHKHVY